ncbi:PilX N-terminal domain-containing pilus assembly protein [Undibacterium sp. TS12]|uniref:pilus assembly PilX family protein n=1 Tax=Undibacterium sp. TS12 TaxID=2908202 RepID=UPI001F4C8883|nr:PilX N-terminal domain-containing pilus assembly protein [Undibacterium sp. TS12]MCH8619689.1 PilX N-terminal domain-containing pilus assembly protein [Undibacterium sp. TS12]
MITALVFLMVLTLLAITAVRRATQDESIAKSMREQNMAFQAAETALRYCQKDFELTTNGGPLTTGATQTVHGIPINLYASGPPDFPAPTLWQLRSNWTTSGYRLPAGTVPDVSAQPECIIEEWIRPPSTFGFTDSNNAGSAGLASAYMITARGQGIVPTSVIWLQVVWYLGGGK